MAGSDLPDMIIFNRNSPTPNLPQFLQQAAADLTPYLAGDAVKDYPNLAAIPTFAWKNAGCAYNGHLYLWPAERYRPWYGIIRNADIYDKEISGGYVPKNANDLKRILVQLNKPKEGRYAWGGSGFSQEQLTLASLWGAPNNWQLDTSGKLVKDFETPQYKEMAGYWRDLWASGLIFPDAYTNTLATGAGPFLKAHTVMTGTSFGVTWTDLWSLSRALSPQPSFLPLPPFAAQDGQKPVHYLQAGYIVNAMMKKASPDRIRELLRIVDWLAAPFGTQEDLLLSYGTESVDYTVDSNGSPIVTSRSNADAVGVGWRYIVQHPQVMNYPGWPEYAKTAYDYEHVAIPSGVEDPTWGLYAPTDSSKGVLLSQTFNAGLRAIVLGQRPLSDFDQLVKDWQTGGGNQIRIEFQQAATASS